MTEGLSFCTYSLVKRHKCLARYNLDVHTLWPPLLYLTHALVQNEANSNAEASFQNITGTRIGVMADK